MLVLTLGGCGGSAPASSAAGGPAAVRLGCFANVTHAQALIGISRGDFQKAIGESKLETKFFNAGPSVVEAIIAGELDLAYIGPGPAINAHVKSKGKLIRIVAGSAANGVAIVARQGSGIDSLQKLAGKKIATPQFGNTQDVSAKHYLTSTLGVKLGQGTEILNIANVDQLLAFKKGNIDVAWAPEPWGARLVHDAGGIVIGEEKDLWPEKRFCTVILIVSKKFFDQHPQSVAAIVKAHEELTGWVNANRTQAAELVNAELAKPELAGKALKPEVLKDSFARTEFTTDPLKGSIEAFASWTHELGFTSQAPELKDLFAMPTGPVVPAGKGAHE